MAQSAKTGEDYRLPEGWGRQQLQAPKHLIETFRRMADAEGHGGVKLVSTAALALFLGAPIELREQLLTWARANAAPRTVQTIDPASAWSLASSFAKPKLNPGRSNIEVVAGKVPMVKIPPANPLRGETHEVTEIIVPVEPPKKPGKSKAAEG